MLSRKLAVPERIKAELQSLACGASISRPLSSPASSPANPFIKYTNFSSFPASLCYFLPSQMLFPLSEMLSSPPLLVSLFGASSASSPPQDGPGPSLSPLSPSPSTSSRSHFCSSHQSSLLRGQTVLITRSCCRATPCICHRVKAQCETHQAESLLEGRNLRFGETHIE